MSLDTYRLHVDSIPKASHDQLDSRFKVIPSVVEHISKHIVLRDRAVQRSNCFVGINTYVPFRSSLLGAGGIVNAILRIVST